MHMVLDSNPLDSHLPEEVSCKCNGKCQNLSSIAEETSIVFIPHTYVSKRYTLPDILSLIAGLVGFNLGYSFLDVLNYIIR